MGQLLAMVSGCALAADLDQAATGALATLASLSGADAVALVRRTGESWTVVGEHGVPLAAADLDADLGAAVDDVPAPWREHGLDQLERHDLPGAAGACFFGWRNRPPGSDTTLEVALLLLDAVLARRHAEEEYVDLVSRVDNAQQLANMGDYDWHIASDTNRWSDQLFRIYGHAPQSFAPTYDSFLSMVHPDDQERIRGVHEEAYRTGEPYQMVERIVRPDGEVRHLASNGQVLRDAAGTPLRFRGTCIDITDRVVAEHAQEELAARMAEAQLRRRQALELNDTVVQGLVAATYALELDDSDQVGTHLAGTLSAARGMMDDLLMPREEETPLLPGDLVRRTAARFDLDEGQR